MNLALHGLLLQVFVSILNFQHGAFLCSAGEPGYLDFDNLPETNFSCQGKVIGGYYADVEAGCQMFHVCTIGQKDEIMDIKFLCLNGTVFDQETRVCERVDEVDCSKSERFYNLNLELYGNNAVTLSLHENTEEEEEQLDSLDDHQQRTTSARPTTTTTTTTTTSRPNKPSSTPSSVPYSHPTGYPQHYQPQPPFPQVHTSQSKSLYDDKNGGYHHQYIFHNGERSNSQATSYQLFSSQGVSSTTVQAPQVHQIRYSSTSSPQIIHNEPSTVTPLFHTSSTIQTLLNSNGNSPALINPIFHNHGIASTTEQFSIHSNNPRDTSEYRDGGEQSIRPLEAVQSTSKGKVSKLTISPVPSQESQRIVQTKSGQSSQQRIPSGFLPTPATIETTIRSFYPTPRSSNSKSTQATQSSGTQHIHVPPPVAIPQLKPHQITINLPPPDIQRIVQHPSPLLPSQSRVIVTAKASVSDESGRPLNSSQLVTLPLPTIPASYDDYKEGDESFDPFYRDVPKIRSNRESIDDDDEEKIFVRKRRSLGRSRTGPFVYDADRESEESLRVLDIDEKEEDISDLRSIKESLMKFRKFLFNEEEQDDLTEEEPARGGGKKSAPLKDLVIGATRNLKARKLDEAEYDADDNDELEAESKESADSRPDEKQAEESVGVTEGTRRKSRYRMVQSDLDSHENEQSQDEILEERMPDLENKRVLDVVILGTNDHVKTKSEDLVEEISTTNLPVISTSEEVTQPSVLETTTVLPEKEVEPARKPEKMGQVTHQNNGGDRREQKPGAKRISARIKSRNRTLRRKQHRNNSVERQKIEKDETTVSPPSLDGSIGKIDSHIFKEEDSQAPKDLDTRAVDQRNRNAVKGSQETKSHSSKNKDDLDSKDYKEKEDTRIVEEHHEHVESKQKEDFDSKDYKEKEDITIEEEHHEEHVDLKEKENTWPEENHDKPLESSSIIPSINEEDTMTEVPTEEEEKEETSNKSDIPDNEHHEFEEEIAIEHHEAVEDVETTMKKTSPEGEVETSSIHESKQSSRHGKSMKFEESLSKETTSHRQDKSRKLDDYNDEETSKESSTVTTIEVHKASEEVSEYFTESSLESQEFIAEEDESETGSKEASTTSTEEEHSEEVSSLQEPSTEETEDNSTEGDDETSTEGVLKFTDELPKADHKDDSMESSDIPESTEGISQDYVDDNYEPDSYKEREDSAESNELNYDKDSKDVSEDSEVKEDRSDYSESTTLSEEVSDEGSLGSEEEYERTLEEHDKTLEEHERTLEEDDRTLEEHERTLEELDSKEEIEENTTILTTSSSTTTTTMRPKLFKPIAARKNYNYIPPTTTPNPVIIKPRIPLLNPKPAKPLKSYNDLVPKPVIRKHPLLTRKYTTSTISTTTEDEHQDDQEATTELIITTTTTTTTTESPRSDENVLESKLETKEQVELHTPKNETLSDQEPSSSQEKSLSNASTRDEESKKATESFTPYPLVRISTLATTIGKMLEEAVTVPSVPEEATTPKSYTFLDLSIVNTTTAASITLAPEKPEVVETSTVEVIIEESTSTTVTPPAYKDPEPPVTELPASTSTSTTPVTSTGKTEVEKDVSKPTTMRLFHRKPMGARKHSSFNCLEKEMYRFYGDNRDCRLFHYCSPGFTSRQVLDFRFVCEEGTAFDEESQSCRHDVRKEKCPNRSW